MGKAKTSKNERARVLKDVLSMVPQDPEALSNYPLLTDLMLPRYEADVCTRVGAVLKVRAQGTCWLVTIECPSEGVQTALGCSTLHDLCGWLEKVLGQGLCNWSETWEVQKRRRQARG